MWCVSHMTIGNNFPLCPFLSNSIRHFFVSVLFCLIFPRLGILIHSFWPLISVEAVFLFHCHSIDEFIIIAIIIKPSPINNGVSNGPQVSMRSWLNFTTGFSSDINFVTNFIAKETMGKSGPWILEGPVTDREIHVNGHAFSTPKLP